MDDQEWFLFSFLFSSQHFRIARWLDVAFSHPFSLLSSRVSCHSSCVLFPDTLYKTLLRSHVFYILVMSRDLCWKGHFIGHWLEWTIGGGGGTTFLIFCPI